MWAEFAALSGDDIISGLLKEGWDENRTHGKGGNRYLILGISVVDGGHSEILVDLNGLHGPVQVRWYPLEFFKLGVVRSLPARWIAGSTKTVIDSGITEVRTFTMGYPDLVLRDSEVNDIHGSDYDALHRVSSFATTDHLRQSARDAIDLYERGTHDVTELASWAATTIDEMDSFHLGLDSEFIELLVELMAIDESNNPKDAADRIWRRL